MTATTDRAERIALARAALASAELRTGARQITVPARQQSRPEQSLPRAGDSRPVLAIADQDGPARRTPDPARRVIEPTGRPDTSTRPLDVPARHVDASTRRPDATPTRPDVPSRGPVLLTDRPPLPVPPAITPLLADGLRRGGTTAVLGSTSLVLAMIAAACTAREAWAAVVGQPSIGLLAAAEAGVGLDRLALVPRPGPDAPSVLAALLDGLDLVVVGPGTALQDADRRRLMARARDRGSVLLATTPWPGAGCVLTVTGGRWTGPGEGDGRLRARELHLTRTGRGAAGGRPEELSLVLPYDGRTDPYGLPAPEPARADRADTGLRLVG